MSEVDAYVMLITSLPSTQALLLAKRAPLSRIKLEQRLRVLTDEDANTLRVVEDAVDWRHFPIGVSEAEVVQRARLALSLISNEILREIVCHRLELRTCIAALRRRSRGEGPPTNIQWGWGRWVNHIERHWTEPMFRLEGVFPWLGQADKKMREADVNGLETLLLEKSYLHLQRNEHLHAFNVEAVVIYVLKWNIVDRLTRNNADAAAKRFGDLTLIGLGDYATLFTDPLPAHHH